MGDRRRAGVCDGRGPYGGGGGGGGGWALPLAVAGAEPAAHNYAALLPGLGWVRLRFTHTHTQTHHSCVATFGAGPDIFVRVFFLVNVCVCVFYQKVKT